MDRKSLGWKFLSKETFGDGKDKLMWFFSRHFVECNTSSFSRFVFKWNLVMNCAIDDIILNWFYSWLLPYRDYKILYRICSLSAPLKMIDFTVLAWLSDYVTMIERSPSVSRKWEEITLNRNHLASTLLRNLCDNDNLSCARIKLMSVKWSFEFTQIIKKDQLEEQWLSAG